MARDVVCGMDVDLTTASFRSEYQGQTYYFCSAGCKREFDAHPEKYAQGATHETQGHHEEHGHEGHGHPGHHH